ncbi:MAG: acylneuraminate cytidylyltransferase family protein, partial [Bacilli bacterium]|nr:acylneuraminate cytidylyltransferase family protein [Bacilli bacterium]
MNVLAVIPACEGSTDLPNRNVRIVHGKPLIYYSVSNAKRSKFITDVVVTSNSDTVLSIARQMGASSHVRDEKLSNPSISLNDVILDALKSVDLSKYDYVAILQSISPNLKVETLDDAIRIAVEEGYDTVVSVSKRKKYFWKMEGNKPIQLFAERVSKLIREPFYEETGAFFISKSSLFFKETKAENVFLYELSEEEAIDVFNFGDLKLVEEMFSKKKVALYVNGNNKRGIGHIYRALEIADEFYCKPDIYYDTNQTDVKVFGSTTHNLIPVNGIHELFKKCEIEQYDLFINDILTTTIDYMIALKTVLPNAKIVNFEDDGEGQIKADLVFNA